MTLAQSRRPFGTWRSPLPFAAYSLAWASTALPDVLALGSCHRSDANKITVCRHHRGTESPSVVVLGEGHHAYAPTRLQWAPEAASSPCRLASSGDMLRLWTFDLEAAALDIISILRVEPRNPIEGVECMPISSFDWNIVAPQSILSASLDSTCTLWDIVTGRLVSLLIAHTSEVYDVSFACQSANVFASTGADGSLRMFDLRILGHCLVLHENEYREPLLRLAWSPHDPNSVATIALNSSVATLVDVRRPLKPTLEMHAHTSSISAISWHSTRSSLLFSAGNDGRALLWNTSYGASGPSSDFNENYSSHECEAIPWRPSKITEASTLEDSTTPVPEYTSIIEQSDIGLENLAISADGKWLAAPCGGMLCLSDLS